ncbi:MAG: hydrophobe/amphiphile efflux-1 (HAE1) family protein [Desulforhopalus sp.]|jgi:hydrophobe/amphiphile efflux-1 (HAE1) family protein
MSRFFIDRPVFAWVLAILTMLAGVLTIRVMPIEQYPTVVAPPQVTINAFYPGASAKTIENSVTQVIEQSLTGIDNLRYFTSTSDSSGLVTITITFEPEADADIAQVQVNNKVQTATPLLPASVQAQGVVVEKSSASFLFVASFYATDGEMTQGYLSDIIASNVKDTLSRVPGVGSVQAFGDPYAMRIWLDPNKLYSFQLSTNEVVQAISEQNIDVSAGQIGGLPAVKGQEINATILAQSRLKTVEEFESIILRVDTDGSQVRLRDVANVSLGEEKYSTFVRYVTRPATGLGISLATGANALETANLVKAKIAELAEFLPEGVEYSYPYDATPFIEISIESVFHTLIEAIVLVFLVMFLFLQNFRATLIPTLAVPVVLLGTFAILNAFGFTINTLTMFAVVLAIGLLVDDAIVVVENVERVMGEEGLSPLEATRKSMDQISGALVGIAMVISAVFIPMAFFSGSAGAIYRQFSITIVSAMTLSVLTAIIFTPTLCVTLLKPVKKGHAEKTTGFFGFFNKYFNKSRDGFHSSTGYMAGRMKRSLVVYGLICAGLFFMFQKIPTGFLPDEDQGVLFSMVSTPAGASAERTVEAMKFLENYLLEKEDNNVEEFLTVSGFSFAGNGQNAGMGFIMLKDWDSRKNPDQSMEAIAGRIMGAMAPYKDALIFAFYPPPILALGNASGFDFQLIDQTGLGHDQLMAARNQLLGAASQNPKLVGVRPNGLNDVPQYQLDVDMEKARALGVSISEINSTLNTAWGSSYVNDFIDRGRIKKVYVQGDAIYRMQPEDINKWYVKNSLGEMVPFASIVNAHWTYGSPRLERFNGSASMNIQGAPAPGVSSGEAMAEMEKIAGTLPDGINYAWTGLSYEEKLSGSQAGALYAISLIIIFLSLAALYESWAIPFSVLFVVPLGIVGSVVATSVFGLSNDIYFQVALLTTVGLCAKNAILIVEFAKELHDGGMELMEAATTSAKLRFRPIIMTSMAFTLGVLPLAISTGAGSASQNAIGIAVIGGMLSATFLAIFFVPLFFVLFEKVSEFRSKKSPHTAQLIDEGK